MQPGHALRLMLIIGNIWIFVSGELTASTRLNKGDFDITMPRNQGLTKTASVGSFIAGDRLEASLLPGGYFTLGTAGGTSGSPLDDHCPLLFGHPFAKTSYPLIKINGMWGKIERFVSAGKYKISSTTTSTQLQCSLPKDSLDLTLSLAFPTASAGLVDIAMTVKNTSSSSKNIQAAFVLDPAMGTQSGDANAWTNTAALTQETVSTSPDSVVLKEKADGLSGLMMSCKVSAGQLSKTIFANWNSLADNDSLETISSPAALYDLCMKHIFTGKSLAPGESYSCSITLSLLDPQFGKSLFVRWETPRSCSIQNSDLFPQNINSRLIVYNSSTSSVQCSVKTTLSIGTADSMPCLLNVAALDYAYKIIPLTFFERYKTDIISPIAAQVMINGQLSDAATLPIFIPSSPYSDAGLKVNIDSFFTSGTTRNLVFSVKKQADSVYILDLNKGNVFIYENGILPSTITLGKDTTGGASAVDIVFVLDVTGSMTNEINGVKNNIVQFADAMKKKAVDFRLGMVTFLDNVENTYPLTSDVATFQSYVNAQSAHGGDDEPENSLEALNTASKMSFRTNAKILFIWITDAPYHTQGDGTSFTSLTVKPVLDNLLAKDISVFSIGPVNYQTQWYMPLYDPTGGQFYDINGNFQDILLDIANLKSSKKYLVSYSLPAAFDSSRSIILEIHTQGLGGKDTVGNVKSLGKKTAPRENALHMEYKAGKHELLISHDDCFSGLTMIMCNLQGKTVLTEKLSPMQSSQPLGLATFKNITKGVYLITLRSVNKQTNAKISITRRINIL